jgi:hypothetical protein
MERMKKPLDLTRDVVVDVLQLLQVRVSVLSQGLVPLQLAIIILHASPDAVRHSADDFFSARTVAH